MTAPTRCLTLIAVLTVLCIQGAAAAELVEGGFAAAAASDPALSGAAEQPVFGGDGSNAVLLDFTPRGGAGLFAQEQAEDAPRLHFELNMASTPADWSNALTGDGETRPSWLVDPSAGLGELSIGGALRWSEWSLGGGFARTALFGGEADLMSATVGYGALTARLAYGQSQGPDLRPLDVMMLSTDLAAASWLTVESNVALGSSHEADSVAVGRLGVRLNF